ncbi:hypothetical protein N7470_006376 [Penicillium chermesinum]|nr:hypothetical protein N7470_006376 [Penicillium chermesinum]
MSSIRGHKIIVGVDYGTTFTGVSFVNSSQGAENIHVIRTWPGPARVQDETWKTPSRIAYKRENLSLGEQDVAWGYQVTPRMKSYTWTKLLLDNQKKHILSIEDLDIIQGHGLLAVPSFKRQPREVCADYLAEIYTYIISYLERRLTHEILGETSLVFYFTIPAIWSDKAKQDTWDAARVAGFGSRPKDDINMITEPEAAALATFSSFSNNLAHVMKAGESVLICDCGGGTVDIVTYLITQVQPVFKFEEVLIGTGGKCGSSYIDRNFHRWMSETFGSAFDTLRFEKKGPGSVFMKSFEAEKRDFGASQTLNKTFEIDLVMQGVSSSTNYNAEDGLVTVVLVGGFGDSPWLFGILNRWCLKRSITLVCPEDPQASVVKGAALQGLNNMRPQKRKARVHYGFSLRMDFREGIDPESESYISPWDGAKLCSNRISWVIEKGTAIGQGDDLPYHWLERVHKGTDGSLESSIQLYTCYADSAPDWYDILTYHNIGVINYKFEVADLPKLRRKSTADGGSMWLLEFRITIDLLATKGILEFKVLGLDNKKIGEASIEYI